MMKQSHAEKRRDAVAQHDATRMGYTDHHSGMYSDRFQHKNLQTDAGRYNWLGDNYKEPDRSRPDRFKNKQFQNSAPQWYPGSNVEGNLYGLNGKRVPGLREGDVFASVRAERQDRGSTKVGFGFGVGKTKFVPDMSTAMRQARYTHALKREARGTAAPSAADLEALEQERSEAGPVVAWGAEQETGPNMYEAFEEEEEAGAGSPGRRGERRRPSTASSTSQSETSEEKGASGEFVSPEKENEFLKFVPGHLRERQPLDTRQQRQKKSTKPRHYGLQRPTSATIGEGVWAQHRDPTGPGGGFTSAPKFKHNATKYFTDKTHVGVSAAPGKDPFVGPSATHYRTSKR